MCEEHHAERTHTEHAILDIGQDVGALIIYTNESLRGKEIEVSPQGHDERKVHTQVLERRFNGHTFFAALYLELPAAEYQVWGDDQEPVAHVNIVGGCVAEITL
jgi:hypothetical protein